jgi:hypothetical protein
MKKKINKNIKSKNLVSPLFKYSNAKLYKAKIFEESNGMDAWTHGRRAGIYCWINKVNNKKYIGSAINLRARFYVYYSRKA